MFRGFSGNAASPHGPLSRILRLNFHRDTIRVSAGDAALAAFLRRAAVRFAILFALNFAAAPSASHRKGRPADANCCVRPFCGTSRDLWGRPLRGSRGCPTFCTRTALHPDAAPSPLLFASKFYRDTFRDSAEAAAAKAEGVPRNAAKSRPPVPGLPHARKAAPCPRLRPGSIRTVQRRSLSASRPRPGRAVDVKHRRLLPAVPANGTSLLTEIHVSCLKHITCDTFCQVQKTQNRKIFSAPQRRPPSNAPAPRAGARLCVSRAGFASFLFSSFLFYWESHLGNHTFCSAHFLWITMWITLVKLR